MNYLVVLLHGAYYMVVHASYALTFEVSVLPQQRDGRLIRSIFITMVVVVSVQYTTKPKPKPEPEPVGDTFCLEPGPEPDKNAMAPRPWILQPSHFFERYASNDKHCGVNSSNVCKN